jgi:hypothetical protein
MGATGEHAGWVCVRERAGQGWAVGAASMGVEAAERARAVG